MGVQFAGNILVQSNGAPLPIVNGGTGQTSAAAAINALLPTQAANVGKVLTTDGTNVSWVTASGGGTPGGSDTQIQFNDAGTFGGSANFVINKATGALTGLSTLTNIGLVVSNSVVSRALKFQTSGSDRWILETDATAESLGTQVGSNFALIRVADNGSTTNQVFTIARSSGVLDFKTIPTINGSAVNAASAITGTTLASNVTASSLTTVGTLVNLTVTNTITGSISGNAATATSATSATTATSAATLTTARNINGVSFNGSADITVTAAAGTLTGATLAAGVTASSLTSVGTLASLAVTGAITKGGLDVGYLEVPQLSGTTFTLASSGKHFFNTSASTVFNIPGNTTGSGPIAFPVGTAITFVNQGSGTATVQIITGSTDTLYLAGAGTTGTRTLAAYGMATALKITSTSWIMSGTGLT